MSENFSKKIRGSAVVDPEGLFVFTPYGTREEADRSLKLVFSSRNATLWEGKNHFALRIRVPKHERTTATQLAVGLLELHTALARRQREIEQEAAAKARKGGRR